MLDIEFLAVDPTLSKDGVWFPFISGAELLLSRYNNEDAERMRRRLYAENLETLQKEGPEAEALHDSIQTTVLAHCILKDWRGFASKGKPLKYTPELGLKYLSDPQYVDFKNFVENNSQNREKYRLKAEEEAVETVKDTADS